MEKSEMSEATIFLLGMVSGAFFYWLSTEIRYTLLRRKQFQFIDEEYRRKIHAFDSRRRKQ